MDEQKVINVTLSTDENGLIGRECPSCGVYFKIKPGTGLPTTQCSCPYCDYKAESNEFMTQDQKDYLTSIAAKKFLAPLFQDFANDLTRLSTPSNGFIQLKISASVPDFTIQYYQEKILETNVTCDTCGLIFSIYGVFSNCPDCGKLNARVIYDKSLDTSNGKLILSGDEAIDEHIRTDLLKDALTGTVSVFDSLGKALRAKHSLIPAKPNNLFQNLAELNKVLVTLTGKSIGQYLTPADSDFLFLMFQARHIYEHNAGVIDNNFVKKLPTYTHQLGRKFILQRDGVRLFVALMRQLGDAIYSEFEK